MALVTAIMGIIVFAIVSVSVGYPILRNTSDTLTTAPVNGTATASGTDGTLVSNIPTIFLLGVFVTIASSMI